MADEKHGIEVEIDSRPASAGEGRVIRSLENIKKKTQHVTQEGYVAADRAGSGFKAWSSGIDRTTRSMDNIRAKARQAGNEGASAADRAQAAWNRATSSIDRATAAAARLHPTFRQIEGSMNRVSRQRPFENATASSDRFHSSLINIRSALASVGAIVAGQEIARTAVQFKGFDQALTIVTGSAAGAAQQMAVAEGIATKLGFRVRDITQGFVGFSAAANGTSLEGEKTKEVFEAITRAAAAYGLTNEQLKGSLLAVQQMIGKGTVSAEELRGQLGERLPGAVQIAARAMNMTTAQLFKMMEQGQLVSDVFLTRFANQLNKEIPQSAKSANKAFNDFLSQLDRTKIALAEGGLFKGMTDGATALAKALQDLATDGSLNAIGSALGSILKFLGENIGLLKTAAIAYGVYWAATKVAGLGIVAFVAQQYALNVALGATGPVAAAAGVGIKAFQIALATVLSPLGLVVIGVTALIGIYSRMSSVSGQLETIMNGTNKTLMDAATALGEAKGWGEKAADAVRDVGADAATSEPKIRSFAGAVGEAAQKLYDLARARQADKISELEAKRTEASVQYSTLYAQTNPGIQARGLGALNKPVHDVEDLTSGLAEFGGALVDQWSKWLGYTPDDPELQGKMADLKKSMGMYDDAIRRATQNLEAFTPKPEAALPPPKATNASRTANAEVGRHWTAEEAAAEFRKRGFRITDTVRTRAQQQAQIDKWEAQERVKKGSGGLRPAGLDGPHVQNRGIDFGREHSKESIKKAAKEIGVPYSQLLDEGDHKHMTIRRGAKGGEGDTGMSSELQRQIELQERREENEADFWQVLKNETKEAAMLPAQAEQYNRELELRRILNDGLVSGTKEVTEEQKKQIADAITAKNTAAVLTDLGLRRKDAIGDTARLEAETKAIAQGTTEEIEDRLELENRMWDHKQMALDLGVSLQDETVRLALEELEAREKANIAIARKNQLIREGNDLVDQLNDERNPRNAIQREYTRNLNRINASTRSQSEKDEAVAQLAKNFREDMRQVALDFQNEMFDAIDEIADGFEEIFGESVGRAVASVAKAAQLIFDDNAENPRNTAVGKIAGGLSDLNEKLGKDGELIAGMGKMMKKVGIGAAVGDASADVMKMLGFKKYSRTGAQLGGAAGMAAFGPIGSIVGSVAGGVIGSFFKKSKTGSATLTGTGDLTTVGSSRAYREAATGAAKSVTEGLSNIARALGGTVGSFGGITIGQRDGDWRVNAGGTSLKTKKGAKDFGEDQSSAIYYAVQLAVQRGAIQGLSEATSRVLSSAGSNLEAAVQTAQVYEDLVRQARVLADPIKGAFDEFNRGVQETITQLRSVGYTEEDIAKLQVLFAKQQKDILAELTDGYRNLLDEMTKGPNSGKTVFAQFQEALAGFRELRQSGTYTQDQFTTSGQNVFELARQVYGTATPEFEAIKAELVAATQAALNQVETATSASRDASVITDAVTSAAAAAAAQRNEQTELLRQINASLGGGGYAANDAGYAPSADRQMY